MKLHFTLIFLYMLTANILAASPIAIHIYNPWVDNSYRQDSISIYGNNEVGYYPGKKMESDGAGWFTFIFKTMPVYQNDGFQFASSIGTPTDANAKRVTFPTSTITFHYLDSLFNGATEFWIIPDDSIKKFNIYSVPPDSKVIHLFNPWPDNSPQIVISGNKNARRMQVNTNICGWYTYYFNGFVDSLKQVSFTDYYGTSKYMSGGLNAGKPIDLSTIFSTHDTIYILPRPFPSGPPSISTTFPGRIGDCPTREFSAIVYDQKMDMISFFDGSKRDGKVVKGMVKSQLGTNGKPMLGANAHTGFGDSLETWFITKKVNTTDSNRTCIKLKFTKGYDGRWEFDSDLKGGFFPIDDFNPYKDKLYQGDDKRSHNFHFTMEMHMQFAYHQGKNQTFMFRGDDDVWIFVNNKLAIDLGSLHNASTNDSVGRINSSDTLRLDRVATTLGLTDGGNYPMDIFYCERQPSGSNLFIKTSIDLRNSDELFTKETVISKGKTEYSIRQYHKTEQTGCGTTIVNTTEEKASVEFFLSGPQFLDSLKHLDPVKTYFEGIIIQSDSTFTIDSAQIKGLANGRYTITFISKFDQNRSGQVSFIVADKEPAVLYADPPDGSHFTSQQYVKLSTNADARIYFTIDGTEPDTNNAAQLYSDSILIKKSLTIKAIATGENYIHTSGTFSFIRDLIPLKAFYYDRNADGKIDAVSVKLDFKASTIPDTLLVSAYAKIQTILKDHIKLSDDGLSISAVIDPQLSSGNQKTDDAGSGKLRGLLFDNTGFEISDSVAPVLKSAVFTPDFIEENMNKLGTLKVKFSEPVQTFNSEYPFNFYQNGTKYKLKLKLISISRDEAIFTVLSVEGINFPIDGDSLNITPSQGIKDVSENEQNDSGNIRVPMKVLPQPYAVHFQMGPNPFEPGISMLNFTDNGITISSGTTIIADFKANLKGDAEKIKAEISIYDPVGNILCKASESHSINGMLEVKTVTNTSTKVFFVWSGHNKSGRKVGSGSYFAMVRITDPSGNLITNRYLIGVKR